MAAPGWEAFDQDVVDEIVRRNPEYVGPGGMRSPLRRDDALLGWKGGDVKAGTEARGKPPVCFRASPTYVLTDPMENFIALRRQMQQLFDGGWSKAEKWRLGNENSEDALSANVFGSLSECGQLPAAAAFIAGIREQRPAELLLWGREMGTDPPRQAVQIREALQKLEKGYSQQTEPDVVLRIHGWGWIFIEAKFGSPTDVAGTAKKVERWKATYPKHCAGVFGGEAYEAGKPAHFPSQLLRNVALAHAVSGGERAHVVALVRRRDAAKVTGWARGYVVESEGVTTGHLTWEDLFSWLPADDDDLAALRAYMTGKSYRLRRAFDLDP